MKIIGVKKNQLKEKALTFRKQGKSYNEIHHILKIPKSTLSNWFKNLPFSLIVKNNLINKNKKIWAENIIHFNKLKPLQTRKRHNKIKEQAKKEFDILKNDPLFTAGISIYWGEGDKCNNGRVLLTNSDYRIVKLFRVFLETICEIPKERMRVGVYLYKDLNKKNCLNKWSKILNIPQDQFIKVQILPSRSKLTKNRLKYGIACLYTCSTELKIKILAWIELFYKIYADVV